MRLRHIVPTLGLIAAAGTAQAVETAPGLTIGGFVDTTLSVITNEDMVEVDDTLIDFSANAELQVGYAISEVVQLQADIEFYAGEDTAASDVFLEQAYVAYGVSDQVTLMMGKWEGLIGYEAWDAPNLYRVNTSPVFDLNGVRPIGLDVNIKGNENFSADVYLVNGVLIDDQVDGAGTTSGNTALGLGASLTYSTETYLVDLDLAYDMQVDAAENSLLGINISGEYSGMENLVAFGDFAYRSYDADDIMGIMVGANYAFNPKASATLMITFIEDGDDMDIVDEEMEVALAILTMPTGDENFAVNFELNFLTPEADGGEDEIGFYVEMLGIIP